MDFLQKTDLDDSMRKRTKERCIAQTHTQLVREAASVTRWNKVHSSDYNAYTIQKNGCTVLLSE